MDTERLKKVLEEVDGWVHQRRARRMDLVGDYAGDEFFVVDGDSLCQVVLGDQLVAIGRDGPNFQVLHAIYRLEQEILQLKRRNCNFEIVFFESNKHSTILTGASKFIMSSRYLAREIIKSHIRLLSQKTDVHNAQFEDLQDPRWHDYVREKQPMFALLRTGPSSEKDIIGTNPAVVQSRLLGSRAFLLNLLASRLGVATFDRIEYTNFKVLAFVYERQRLTDVIDEQPEDWVEVSSQAAQLCEGTLEHALPTPMRHSPSNSRRAWLVNSAKDMLAESTNSWDAPVAFVFLAAQLAMVSMSTQQRALHRCLVHKELVEYLESDFYPAMFRHLANNLTGSTFFPDLDGNLFLIMLKSTLKTQKRTPEKIFGADLAGAISSAWVAAGLPLPTLDSLPSRLVNAKQRFPAVSEPEVELLPFSHPVFDQYLPHISTMEDDYDSDEQCTRIEALCDEPFLDEKRWNRDKSFPSDNPGGNENRAPLSNWEKMKKLRREQRFMANLQRHAQTLTGAKGQPIKRIVIVESTASAASSVSRPDRNPKDTGPKSPGAKPNKSGKGGKTKTPQLNSTQKLKAKIEAEKQTKKSTEDDGWWKSQLKEIGAMEDIVERLRRVDLILQGKRAESGWLSVEVSLYRINLILESWVTHDRNEDESVCEDYTVRILHAIHQLRAHPSLFHAASNILNHLLDILGFGSVTSPTPNDQDDRELNFKFVKLVKSKSGRLLYPYLRIKISPIEFQLKAYGAFMDRSMDSAPDPRVRFEPDGWQRKVLDRIDRNESTLVVAPTSAGKTFSSFYAMEKVLRESNDGIIVYVSPTKALCQQIAADVYARFSKNIKGKTVWAVHTRDFRVNDPLRTQILVTVPEILSIMLLSPSLSKVWVPHLKFIILDEIHSIGEAEGGQVWEQIILLSTCPILGLSATVGQPETFSAWLGSVQKEHEKGYAMVEHKYRYSHLRKYVWEMPSVGSLAHFGGLRSSPMGDSHLRVLHPMSALLLGGRTIPPDLALESHDCLSLYSMMAKCAPRSEIQHLDPCVFFQTKDKNFLAQVDVIRYEEALKEVVEKWINAKDSREPDSLYQRLLGELEGDMSRFGPINKLEDVHPREISIKGFIHLLHKLNSNGDLPCLAFNFDRAGCESFAKALVEHLVEGEHTWRQSNHHWLQKMEQWEEWKASARNRQREADRASRRKPEDPAEEQSTPAWQSTFDPTDPSPEFSFANPKSGYSKEELQDDIADQKWQQNLWPDYIIEALRRGIAVHHAGMPKGYRVLVESLFRLGYCRVVISTGKWSHWCSLSTLALGINAPAKSAIFLGDSPFLTALMYRQCAGRAGRRGFDLLGKSPPPLTGNWPLTTTLCLRLFHLITGSDEAPAAVTAIDSFMRLPQLSLSSNQTRNEVLHHMRFSIEFLRRLRLLSEDGRVTALFGAVSHLHYEEPGNLVFASLVRSGIIHQLCSNYRNNPNETKRNIIHLVATLFARIRLSDVSSSKGVLRRLRASSPSLVKLPPLPPYIQKALKHYNEETLEIFSAYAITYAHQHLESKPDDLLPFSRLEVGLPGVRAEGTIGNTLNEYSIKNLAACSAFVSNSGHGDSFGSVAELCRSTRSELHLDAHAIPHFDYNVPINAYAYDYWQHESVRSLVHANGLGEGEVWFELQNFSKALVAILASLRVLLIDRVSQPKPTSYDESSEDEELADQFEKGIGIGDAGDEQEEALAEGELLGELEVTARPYGVPEKDWLVYIAFQSASSEFYEKWKKMWA
ncbi:hypothetical protein B0J17DRAFT_771475 [Rhizoctonia solani]|nr:hypothetical protein B0J17DRAFT_771475 [Rhizoctonia solani]